MDTRHWALVDAYIADCLLGGEAGFDAALRANAAAGLPSIDVSVAQGKFLELLVKMSGAKRVLEIGTLGGYSTLFMARALPAGGRLISLEYVAHHAAIATANIRRAGFADKVEVRVGAAAETLPKLAAEGAGPFDFVFIDADKPNNPIYLDWALKMSRPGTVIVVDNVIRQGSIIEAQSGDASVNGSRAAFDLIGADSRLSATALQTVGEKGYDGFILAWVN